MCQRRNGNNWADSPIINNGGMGIAGTGQTLGTGIVGNGQTVVGTGIVGTLYSGG